MGSFFLKVIYYTGIRYYIKPFVLVCACQGAVQVIYFRNGAIERLMGWSQEWEVC